MSRAFCNTLLCFALFLKCTLQFLAAEGLPSAEPWAKAFTNRELLAVVLNAQPVFGPDAIITLEERFFKRLSCWSTRLLVFAGLFPVGKRAA